jgi:hypothetical protein
MHLRKFQNICKFVVSVAFFVCYGFSCGDDTPDPEYNFTIKLKVINESKIYRIGDTLHLAYKLSANDLFDNLSQKNVALENLKTDVSLYFGVRNENFNLKQNPDIFDLNIAGLENHEVESNGQWSTVKFTLGCPDIDKIEWNIKIDLILKKSGIFMINPNRFPTIEFGENKDCLHFRYGNIKYVFDNFDTNPELINNVPIPTNTFISGDDIPPRTANKEIFWINVKS